MASDDIYILGISMTKFGKHTDLDIVDLGAQAAMAALADAGMTMADMGILAAGNLMGAGGYGQQLQKQIGQTAFPSTTCPMPAPLVPRHFGPPSWR